LINTAEYDLRGQHTFKVLPSMRASLFTLIPTNF